MTMLMTTTMIKAHFSFVPITVLYRRKRFTCYKNWDLGWLSHSGEPMFLPHNAEHTTKKWAF